MKSRAERIAEKRRQQPIDELERKYVKAGGRYSRAFWLVEAIDLAYARGAELHRKMFPNQYENL